MKKNIKLIGAGLLTAVASSLCCIIPFLALISGTTGVASNFSWLEPIRPYLIIFTILVLGFAWYQKLKPKKGINCNCQTNDKISFFQSKIFLGLITVFAFLMVLFPFYSFAFYSKTKNEVIEVNKDNLQTLNLTIKGMTCNVCEEYINYSVLQLDGILNIHSSYKNEKTTIVFDNPKTAINNIKKQLIQQDIM